MDSIGIPGGGETIGSISEGLTMNILLKLAFCIIILLSLSFDALPITGEKAPHFVLKDIDGNTASLSDFQDRVVVIDFWATWCHACEETSPVLERVHRKYKDREVVVLGISLDEGSDAIEKVREFIDRFSLTYTHLMGNSQLADEYRIMGIPTTFVLDRNHRIVGRYSGALFGLEEIISGEIEKVM